MNLDRMREVAEKATAGPWPADYVKTAVRHVARNCDFIESTEAPEFGWDRYADAEFIAISLNAFDVMMRRGVDWLSLEPMDGKMAVDIYDYGWMPPVGEFQPSGLATGARFADPFTAWVEADKWYKENVEAKQTVQGGA